MALARFAATPAADTFTVIAAGPFNVIVVGATLQTIELDDGLHVKFSAPLNPANVLKFTPTFPFPPAASVNSGCVKAIVKSGTSTDSNKKLVVPSEAA
jgi:hypothetical protein